MDLFAISPGRYHNGRKLPVILIIQHHVLMRTCILSILKRELVGFELVEIATMADLDRWSERDVCLIVFDIWDNSIQDPRVDSDLAALSELFPNAAVALLSNRHENAIESPSLRRRVRGFFPSSIPLAVAIAGLRLVLAGGAYWPLPVDTETIRASRLETTLNTYISPLVPAEHNEISSSGNGETKKFNIDLTPREKQVLAELELGLSNKLIASKLNLSENTVKMHIQHIMRKCSARNRTEVVLFCSGRLSRGNAPAYLQQSSSRELDLSRPHSAG